MITTGDHSYSAVASRIGVYRIVCFVSHLKFWSLEIGIFSGKVHYKIIVRSDIDKIWYVTLI